MGKGALRYSSESEMPEGMRKMFQRQTIVGVDKAAPGTDVTTIAIAEARKDGTLAFVGNVQLPPRHAAHRAGEMNKTEARYAQHLEARRIGGEVKWWAFERIKLRLAPGTHLTVDFFVQLPDGTLECHEVKGRKGERFWAEEDAKVKIKVAAELFPIFAFRIVWPAKGGGWKELQLP